MAVFCGKEEQFASAYKRNADMLYRIALSYLSRSHDAEDACQEAFAKYIASPPPFINENAERAWLIRVTVNCCKDMLRRRRLRDHAPLDDAMELSYTDEPLSEVTSLLSSISVKNRSVVILHCLEGFSVEESAKLLGISVSAAKMRLLRGREELRAYQNKEED